jgi:hypothetical protein
VTPKVEKKVPCVCCRSTLVWVFPGRSYLPGPLCRECREMAEALEDAS